LNEIQNLDGIGAKIEKIFQAPAPEELEQIEQENLGREAIDDMQNYQRRQNLAQGAYKLKLRSTSLLMAQGICFVSHYSREQAEAPSIKHKCKLIYNRLLDIMLKLDHIPNEEKGEDYLDPNQLNTELRLQ